MYKGQSEGVMTFFVCSSLDFRRMIGHLLDVLTFFYFFALHLTLGRKQTTLNCAPPFKYPGTPLAYFLSNYIMAISIYKPTITAYLLHVS